MPIIGLYLVPALDAKSLARPSVPAVQIFLNQQLEAGDSVRKVQAMRSVLSAAPSRAIREELITRNVASPPQPPPEIPDYRPTAPGLQSPEFGLG
jgi:hypothetical protein